MTQIVGKLNTDSMKALLTSSLNALTPIQFNELLLLAKLNNENTHSTEDLAQVCLKNLLKRVEKRRRVELNRYIRAYLADTNVNLSVLTGATCHLLNDNTGVHKYMFTLHFGIRIIMKVYYAIHHIYLNSVEIEFSYDDIPKECHIKWCRYVKKINSLSTEVKSLNINFMQKFTDNHIAQMIEYITKITVDYNDIVMIYT